MKPYQLPDEQLRLPTGYILMERSRDYVLAFNPDYSRDRYATWFIAHDGYLCYGDYFCTPKSAVIDFEARSGVTPGAGR